MEALKSIYTILTKYELEWWEKAPNTEYRSILTYYRWKAWCAYFYWEMIYHRSMKAELIKLVDLKINLSRPENQEKLEDLVDHDNLIAAQNRLKIFISEMDEKYWNL
jgi:hypothetical protein